MNWTARVVAYTNPDATPVAPEQYTPPHGTFVVASDERGLIGYAGLRATDEVEPATATKTPFAMFVLAPYGGGSFPVSSSIVSTVYSVRLRPGRVAAAL